MPEPKGLITHLIEAHGVLAWHIWGAVEAQHYDLHRRAAPVIHEHASDDPLRPRSRAERTGT